jgi:hypothetical protein
MATDHDERILFLFRHGETDWNREGRLQGDNDTPLNTTGLAQAQALGESLRPHRLDAVVSSDLARARTTAQIVADASHVPLFIEAGLRETDVGAAEGLLWADAKTRFGEGLTERWYSDGDVAFPGGETGVATRMRGLAGLRRFTTARLPPHRRLDTRRNGAPADETCVAARQRAGAGSQHHGVRAALRAGQRPADRRRKGGASARLTADHSPATDANTASRLTRTAC